MHDDDPSITPEFAPLNNRSLVLKLNDFLTQYAQADANRQQLMRDEMAAEFIANDMASQARALVERMANQALGITEPPAMVPPPPKPANQVQQIAREPKPTPPKQTLVLPNIDAGKARLVLLKRTSSRLREACKEFSKDFPDAPMKLQMEMERDLSQAFHNAGATKEERPLLVWLVIDAALEALDRPIERH